SSRSKCFARFRAIQRSRTGPIRLRSMSPRWGTGTGTSGPTAVVVRPARVYASPRLLSQYRDKRLARAGPRCARSPYAPRGDVLAGYQPASVGSTESASVGEPPPAARALAVTTSQDRRERARLRQRHDGPEGQWCTVSIVAICDPAHRMA